MIFEALEKLILRNPPQGISSASIVRSRTGADLTVYALNGMMRQCRDIKEAKLSYAQTYQSSKHGLPKPEWLTIFKVEKTLVLENPAKIVQLAWINVLQDGQATLHVAWKSSYGTEHVWNPGTYKSAKHAQKKFVSHDFGIFATADKPIWKELTPEEARS